jgi:hypothetical protein
MRTTFVTTLFAAAAALLNAGAGIAHAESSSQGIGDGLLNKECIAVPTNSPQAAIQSFIGQNQGGEVVILHAYAETTPQLAGNHATAAWPWAHDKAPKKIADDGSIMSDHGSQFFFKPTANGGLDVTLKIGYREIRYTITCSAMPTQSAQK